MTIAGASILANPPIAGHIVYPYTDDERCIEAVYTFAQSGLKKGDAVVLVMTDEHCEQVRGRLSAGGLNISKLDASGQLQCIEAAGLLATFMVNGVPDEDLFSEALAKILGRARASSSNGSPRPVRVFGEMVSLLWRENEAAALRLEQMWCEAVRQENISLFCTYDLGGTKESDFPKTLAACHTHYIV